MVASWPSNLPQAPLGRSDFVEQPQPNIVSFKPSIGPSKARRRSTAASTMCDMTFVFTESEYADFEEFFRTTLADGTLPFEWDHPRTGVTYLWRFDPETPYRAEDDIPMVRVKFKLERLP